jgi:plastocyanin
MRSVLVRGGLAAAIVMASTMWAWPASAGGGCHRETLTEGEGFTVAMSKACFDPGVLRVDPGTEVTFVNEDPIIHNVSATGWGYFGEMRADDSFRATFDEEGVYPFACTYHPGMTGAIVVGDGVGAGSGVTVGAVDSADSGSGTVARPAAVDTDGTPAVGWAVGGAGGFLIGAAAGLLLRRRRLTTD